MKYLLQVTVLSIFLIQISGNVLDTVTDIRLAGGSGPYEGRVELAVSGIWGTICDTNFDIEDADVLCRMLNLQATAFMRGAHHGQGTGPVYADNLQCSGQETDVGDCRYDTGSTCSHTNDVSVICTDCGLIRWGNGNLSVSSDGTTLQILCDYQTSNKISVCQQNGTWTNPAMYCPHPECDQSQIDICGGNASCFIESGEPQCKCNKGFDNSSESCEDIDKCEQSPCSHKCINTDGSYQCICNDGYRILSADQHICRDINECEEEFLCTQVCNNYDGGYNCSCVTGYVYNKSTNICEQNQPTADVCSKSDLNCSLAAGCTVGEWGNAICFCDPGYELIGTNVCVDCMNAVCPLKFVNVNSSFVLECIPGYQLVGLIECEECPEWTYGVDCAENCSCNQNNTERCETNNGTCACYKEWTGTDCSDDVNECEVNYTCSYDHFHCVNTIGGFYCACDLGFAQTDINTCEACSNWTFGEECASNCSCERSTTESCDHITGQCMCKEGWQGIDCGIDVDECDDDTTCPKPHSLCYNTIGGFECYCENGYYKSSDASCRVMKIIVTHIVEIDMTLPPDAYLNNKTYSALLDQQLIDALKVLYLKRVTVVLLFYINDKMFIGSLIVNYTVAYDTRVNQVMSDIVKVIQDLNEGSVMEFDGNRYPTNSVSVSSNDACAFYRNVVGECDQGYQCIVENGAGICREHNAVYILSITIVVFVATLSLVLLGIIICVVLWLRKRSNRRRKKRHTHQRNKSHDFYKYGTSISEEMNGRRPVGERVNNRNRKGFNSIQHSDGYSSIYSSISDTYTDYNASGEVYNVINDRYIHRTPMVDDHGHLSFEMESKSSGSGLRTNDYNAYITPIPPSQFQGHYVSSIMNFNPMNKRDTYLKPKWVVKQHLGDSY